MFPDQRSEMTRRDILTGSALGFDWLASHCLAQGDRSRPARPHYPPRARAVIMLVQNGGPGQMDFFDPKPDLAKHDGAVHTEKVETFQKGSEDNKLLKSPFTFHRHGRCGMELSEAIPHIGKVADDQLGAIFRKAGVNSQAELIAIMTDGTPSSID